MSGEDSKVIAELERMSRLLALVAVRGLANREAAPLLVRAGYTMQESGRLLGVTKQAVGNLVTRSKVPGAKAGRRKKTKK